MTNNVITTNDVRVNYNSKTIVITKKFARKVENPISKEFEEFMKLRDKLVGFEVEVKTTSKRAKRETLKGLNYSFMKQYIERHDEDGTAMAEFIKMTVKDEDNLASYSYGEVKSWFLNQYPQIKKSA